MARSSERAHRHLVGIGQAAEHAGVSTKTIRRRIADGSLIGYRFGPKLIRIDLAELDAAARVIPSGVS